MLFNEEYEFLYEDIRDGKYALDKEQMLYLTIAGNKFKYLINTLYLITCSNVNKVTVVRLINNTLENINKEYDILKESIE